MRVIAPYLVLGAVVLIWALLLIRTPFPPVGEEARAEGDRGSLGNLFRYPHFMFAVLAQFFYVGAQVGTWSYFIPYIEDYTHESDKVAGYFFDPAPWSRLRWDVSPQLG